MCLSRWERFLRRFELRWNGGYYGGFNEVWQNCLKNVKFFDNLTEIAYQIVGFRQIIKTVRVFDEFFCQIYTIVPKWGASSRWSSFLYRLMRNLDDVTIGKTNPITLSRQILRMRSWHGIRVILSSSLVASKRNI